MTNYEKYKEKFINLLAYDCDIAAMARGVFGCGGATCADCHAIATEWLNSEYTEPEVDWSKVPVDTKILVKAQEYADWLKRYFAYYRDGKVYSWDCGTTSFTNLTGMTTYWPIAKLVEEEDGKEL